MRVVHSLRFNMDSETTALQNQATQNVERLLEVLWREFAPFESSFPLDEAKWRVDTFERPIFGHRATVRDCLQSIQSAFDTGDFLDLANLFEELFELSASFGFGLERYQEQVEDWIEVLNISESEKLFEATEPEIYLPELLVTVNDQLLRFIANKPRFLYELDPRKFEELVAELFYKQGFEVQLTKKTRDGGRDIIAFYQRMNITTKYLIECKRYAPNNLVGIEIVQRLFGVKIAERAHKAILATTSRFTKPAIAFATSDHVWDLELKDYNDIVNWLSAYTTI